MIKLTLNFTPCLSGRRCLLGKLFFFFFQFYANIYDICHNSNFILAKLCKFYRFIEERSFVSDMDMAGLAFFDECTERVEEENGMYNLY